MNKVVGVLSLLAVATVSAAPFLLDAELLRKGSPKLSVLHHVSFLEGETTGATTATSRKLRFVLLVPTFSHEKAFAEGFASHHVGGTEKHHGVTKLGADEHLLELVGLSDCKTWHAAVVKVWNAAAKVVVTKVHAVADHKLATLVVDLAGLADFVHTRVHRDDFEGLVKKGLVAHEFVLRLQALLGA